MMFNTMKKVGLVAICMFLSTPSLFAKLETPAAYESQIPKTGLVVVKFYADWCPPCRAYTPTFKRVANMSQYEQAGVIFLEVNVDTYKSMYSGSIPCTKIFVDGKEKTKKIGIQSQGALQKLIDQYLS